MPIVPTNVRCWGKSGRKIANSDSLVTDGVFAHPYHPSQMGTDTIHHDPAHASHLLLSVVKA